MKVCRAEARLYKYKMRHYESAGAEQRQPLGRKVFDGRLVARAKALLVCSVRSRGCNDH